MFHGRLMSALGLSSATLRRSAVSDVVVCEVERTLTRLLPTARTVLTHSVISASTCFLLLLWLRALQTKDKHTEGGKKNKKLHQMMGPK